MTDLSRFYYNDIPIYLVTIFDAETNQILFLQVTFFIYFSRNIPWLIIIG